MGPKQFYQSMGFEGYVAVCRYFTVLHLVVNVFHYMFRPTWPSSRAALVMRAHFPIFRRRILTRLRLCVEAWNTNRCRSLYALNRTWSLGQWFSTFMRPRPSKFLFYKTRRAQSQQIYS
jgi:hypothetical protein